MNGKEKSNLDEYNVNILKLSNLDLGYFLPINGFLKSRVFSLIILLTKFIPLKRLLKKEKPDFFLMHLITIVPLLALVFSNIKTKFILRISGLPKLNFLEKHSGELPPKRFTWLHALQPKQEMIY